MTLRSTDVDRATVLGFSGYHWPVIAAAWAGWGFDVVPVLPGLPLGSLEAREATVFRTGTITAILLVGWAAGGVLFGWVFAA